MGNHSGYRFHLTLAAVGLAVYLWGFVAQTRIAAWPADEVVAAYPVRLADRPAGSLGELRRLAEAYPPGRSLVLESPDGSSRRITLVTAHPRHEQALILLSGLLFWAVSVFILLPRSRLQGVRGLFWCFLLYGLAVMIGGVYFPRPPVWSASLLNALQILSLALLPAVFVHLSLGFPRRDRILDRHGWFIPMLFGIALGIAAWQWLAYRAYYADPGPGLARNLTRAVSAGSATMILQVGGGILLLYLRGRRLEITRERNQVKTLLWGFFVGVTPYVFLRQLPTLVGLSPPLGPLFDRLFELAIPLIVLFAVARYRLLDIDLIIRRSLIYGSLAGLLMLAYVGLGLLAGHRLQPLEAWNRVLLLATGLGAGVLLLPTRRWIGRRVDRIFFKLRDDYRRRVEVLSERLREAPDQAEIARVLARFLGDALQPTRMIVGLRSGTGYEIDATPPEARNRFASELLPILEPMAVPTAAPDRTGRPEMEQAGFPERLLESGIVLVHPFADRTGWVLLGPKESGWRYIDLDLDLIRQGVDAAGTVLERMRLVQSLTRESMEKERLAELDRMKSDFFAGVAHDLRTPLTAITWSTGNLIDGVAGEMNGNQTAYLESVRTEASRLNRMVESLLEVNRLEQGGIPIELRDLGVDSVAGDAARSVEAAASAKGVRVRVRIEEPIRVPADRDKVYEVMVNLLENAIKYSPPQGSVILGVGRRDGSAGFWVQDEGPGFDPRTVPELFERYRRAEPASGSRRSGFGLGLYIVKRYMELMGGRPRATLRAGGGAEFACLWPGSTKE